MTDLPPPEKIRKPTGDTVHVNSTQGLNTLSVGGKTYNIIDVGYGCGNTTITVLSEFTCLFHPAPFCVVCATCLHPEGAPPVPVPDWVTCGVPAGAYGILVKFKPAWICHCLKMLGYVSTNVNAIQPVGTSPFCGAPSIPTPLFSLDNPNFSLGAAAALGIGATIAGSGGGAIAGGGGSIANNTATLSGYTLPNGTYIPFNSDGGGVPFRPGIDSDIDFLPPTPPGTYLNNTEGCLDIQPDSVDNSAFYNSCSEPNNPPNGNILTIPKIV